MPINPNILTDTFAISNTAQLVKKRRKSVANNRNYTLLGLYS